MILRTDQERALVSLVDEVVAHRKSGNEGSTFPRQLEELNGGAVDVASSSREEGDATEEH